MSNTSSPIAGLDNWTIDEEITSNAHGAMLYPDHRYRQYLCIDWSGRRIQREERHESQNAITMAEYHGHTTAIAMPYSIATSALRTILAEHAEALNALADAYTSEWDGSNMVARFSGVEPEAKSELTDSLHDAMQDNAAELAEADAAEHLQMVGPNDYDITAETTDERLDEIAAGIVNSAIIDGYVLEHRRALQIITGWRDQLRNIDA
jgi:hypothetical protein